MGRLACVDIPFFSLQVLFRIRPEWKGFPAAVVDRNEATGRILSINEAARAKGVRPGIPYSQGLSLAGDLRAATVEPAHMEEAEREIVETLYAFTPEVEPARVGTGEVGSFWLNASGLAMLYPSLSIWTNEAIRALAERGFLAVVAVGFSRFGSYIIARSRRKPIVVSTERQEEGLLRKSPLRVLPLSSEPLALFHRLGIETVGAFLDLPENGVRKRFGREAHEILRWVQRERLPIQPVVVQKEAKANRRLDDPITNLVVLSAYLDELIDELMQQVAAKRKLVAAMTIELFEGEERRAVEEIRPAAPTREGSVLKNLSRLRLAEQRYEGAVDRISLRAGETDPIHRDGDLFISPRRQAAEAGKRAIALIRARFGNDSVNHAVLRDEHLPEEQYEWEAVTGPLFPTSSRGGDGDSERRFRVVRRQLKKPPPPGPVPASFRLVAGPFVLTGKWWASEEQREYYFAHGGRGQFLWLYRDTRTGSWTLQGLVD